MTATHRSLVRSFALITALTGACVMLMSWMYDIAYAANAPSEALPASDDAAGWVAALYNFVTKGSHVPAVGAFLVIVVWALRKGATRIPWLGIGAWFGTVIGGYVLGFGSAALLDFGLALAAGGTLGWALVGVAIGHGYAASGGWEHLKDVLGYLGRKPVAGASAAASFAVVCIAASCSGCPSSVTDSKPVADIIDCTKQDEAKIEALALDLGCKVASGVITECSALSGDWASIEAKAETAGIEIGGCVLAQIVQQYLAKPRALPVAETQKARSALEQFRLKVAHGATFHTVAGDL